MGALLQVALYYIIIVVVIIPIICIIFSIFMFIGGSISRLYYAIEDLLQKENRSKLYNKIVDFLSQENKEEIEITKFDKFCWYVLFPIIFITFIFFVISKL